MTKKTLHAHGGAGHAWFHCYQNSDEPPAYNDVAEYGRLLHQLYDPGDDTANWNQFAAREHFPFVVRRVETIKLLRKEGDERRISLDVDSAILAHRCAGIMLPEEDISQRELLVPIGIFPKNILLRFNSRDSRRNLNLGAVCLSYAAGYAWLIGNLPNQNVDEIIERPGRADLRRRILEQTPAAASVRKFLWHVCTRTSQRDPVGATVQSPAPDCLAEYAEWMRGHPDEPYVAGAYQLVTDLKTDAWFRARLAMLWDNYFPVVVVHRKYFTNCERHMIKFAVTYENSPEPWLESLEPPLDPFLGHAITRPVEQFGVLEAHAEHLRVVCPPGFEFADEPLFLFPSQTPEAELRRFTEHTPQRTAAELDDGRPRFIMHRRTLTVKRHLSSRAEPQLLRYALVPQISDFALPTMFLFLAALGWFVACLVDWQFQWWNLSEVGITHTITAVTIGGPILTSAWSLLMRQRAGVLRGLILKKLLWRIWATSGLIALTIIVWSSVGSLRAVTPSRPNNLLTAAMLPSLQVAAIGLLLLATLVTAWMVIRLAQASWHLVRIQHKAAKHMWEDRPIRIGWITQTSDDKRGYVLFGERRGPHHAA